MCLYPRQIRNPTKHIHKNGGQPLLLEVPCGQCAECKKNKRLEWRFRSFYHIHECVKNGGYVLFDTLTYRDDDVPMLSHFMPLEKNIVDSKGNTKQLYKISDFMCFNCEHWRNFLKNLRRQLEYHHSGVHFTYFLTSEYGTDERYTHRPHYHILFFVNFETKDDFLHPLDFSRLISKCWSYGRTDGIPYQSNAYVLEHVYCDFLGCGCEQNYLKVCNYVSKYITKDSSFQKEIDNRLSLVARYTDEDDFKTIARNINQFHRQSQGFGVNYLNSLSQQAYLDICEKGIVKIEDPDKVVAVLPLPTYYKRKLFYTKEKLNDGSSTWKPTNRGKQYILDSFERNINNLVKRYEKILLNSSNDSNSVNTFNHLLGSRTLGDLAFYNVIFKNRARYVYHSVADISECEKYIPMWLDNILISQTYTDDCDNFYNRDVDNNIICINLKDYNYDSFIRQHTFNEHSSPHFNHFDKLNALLSSMTLQDRKDKQSTFDFIEDLTQKFKHYV